MRALGLSFEVIVSDVDEQVSSNDPEALVRDLSAAKALAVEELLRDSKEEDLLILGADTIVVHDGEILGKPVDEADAFAMLVKLSGKCHQVFTGISIVKSIYGAKKDAKTGAKTDAKNTTELAESFCKVSDVYFRLLEDAEIRAYIATGEPMDKAGSYALQGIASLFVEKINGCYTNIIGLPVPDTVRLLRKHGLQVLGIGGANSEPGSAGSLPAS